MTGRHASGTASFAVSATAVVAFALVLAITAPDRPDPRRPPTQRATPRDPGAGQPIAERSSVRASRRDVALVATSFAVAYLQWDAGRRTRGIAATLRRLGTPAMWDTLRYQRGRPTAQRPHPVRIKPLEVALGSDGRWRVPLTTHGPAGRYLGTVVLARGATSVRVTALDR